jgi:hypothetical protein
VNKSRKGYIEQNSKETDMDDLLARLRAGPTGDAKLDRATMQRAAHEIQRLQVQLQEARKEKPASNAEEFRQFQ